MSRLLKYELPFYGGEIDVELTLSQYTDKYGNLYVGLVSGNEPYADITVNLADQLPKYCGYIDTNNIPNAEIFLKRYGIARFTGHYGYSGYCRYPLYKFDKDRLKELCPEYEYFFHMYESHYDEKESENTVPDAMENITKISNYLAVSSSENNKYNEVFIYVPAFNRIIRMEEGTGENLCTEDRSLGYVDYIHYDSYDLEQGMPENDGGLVMLKELFRDKYSCTEECIPDVLYQEFSNENLSYIVLRPEA